MNYRHAFHAGNFADVFKHAFLMMALETLRAKDKPFVVVDTHAGIGLYDLAGTQAGKTGEWEQGIGRLIARAAADTASIPLPQSRFTVAPGTVSGRPASKSAMRATLRLSSPA